MAHDVDHSERERQRQPPHRKSASTTSPNPTITPILITNNAPSNLPSSIPSFTCIHNHINQSSTSPPPPSSPRSRFPPLRKIKIVRTDLVLLACLALCARSSTSHLALAAILLFSLLIILYRPFQTSTLDQPLPNTSPRPVLPLLSPPLTPTMVFTTPKASPSPMSDRSVSGAPELVGSFVEKYKDIKSRYEEAQAKADKYERLYLELKVRADELAELEASLPTVKRLEAELEHEARLRQKATDELEQLKREQEELLAMQ